MLSQLAAMFNMSDDTDALYKFGETNWLATCTSELGVKM